MTIKGITPQTNVVGLILQQPFVNGVKLEINLAQA